MLRTASLFVLANLASLMFFGPLLGFSGPIGAIWFVAVLQTAPALLLPLLFVWVPVWLWVVAIRRAWSGSMNAERESYIPGKLLT